MRMSQRSLALAFDCFAEAVSTIVAQRQRIAKAMGKWTMPGLIKVFIHFTLEFHIKMSFGFPPVVLIQLDSALSTFCG